MKHTKGKWTVTDKADTFSSTERDIIISDRLNGNGNRKAVARIHGLEDGVNNAELRQEAIANANLIASAPELLEALKRVEKCLDNQFQHRDELIPDWIVEAYLIIEMAIGKAEDR